MNARKIRQRAVNAEVKAAILLNPWKAGGVVNRRQTVRARSGASRTVERMES